MQKNNQQEEEGSESMVCPSFSTYASTDRIADIAERVRLEQFQFGSPNDAVASDFEFVTFRKAADGVFFDDARVGPVFPVFDRDVMMMEGDGGRDAEDAAALQFSMRKLFIDEDEEDQRRRVGGGGDRDPPSSSSSSEADDLEAIPPGTYCVWTPKSTKASPGRCKKSNSTGSSSSKKWKLLDLLRRSNSDGKDSFVFLTPSSTSSSPSSSSLVKKKENWICEKKLSGKEKAKGSGEKKAWVSAHEAFYVKNRELKKVDMRKSYLPYRKDLVGFFANKNHNHMDLGDKHSGLTFEV
ncbi:uncharacterized protein G2W53_025034 [Senna tora]|uniref:Uncharacterized protein n=1 Tax=Senna tora TaxID=362788 RepID=A0A834TDX5_9FABA|nr:uncharacterized protein G2W53_025034 [Senna tora]